MAWGPVVVGLQQRRRLGSVDMMVRPSAWTDLCVDMLVVFQLRLHQIRYNLKRCRSGSTFYRNVVIASVYCTRNLSESLPWNHVVVKTACVCTVVLVNLNCPAAIQKHGISTSTRTGSWCSLRQVESRQVGASYAGGTVRNDGNETGRSAGLVVVRRLALSLRACGRKRLVDFRLPVVRNAVCVHIGGDRIRDRFPRLFLDDDNQVAIGVVGADDQFVVFVFTRGTATLSRVTGMESIELFTEAFLRVMF